MGMLIKNIKDILKNDKIVCWNCKSENIVHNCRWDNSGYTENRIKYRNHELYCKDCNKEFMYSAIENSEEDEILKNIVIKEE
jgi:uncharacterized protein with WD repeat